MATHELLDKPLVELATLIKTKQVSPVALIKAQWAHAQALNPQINAFISFREHALAEAQQAENEIIKGQYRGPLHGLPVALKDNLYIQGEVTTMGAKLHQHYLPKVDATVVRRLKQAGAVVTGKLNMHEYACGITNNNPHFGSVKNPWNVTKIPGGSSGGAGAALASGMALAALGTDTAGSVRIPAAACGVVGFKPTYGRVPKDGSFPLAWTLDHIGPMTRCVDDAALLLQAIAGFSVADPSCLNTTPPDFSSGLAGNVHGLVIGIEHDYLFHDIDAGIARLVATQIDQLCERGAIIKPVKIPSLEHAAWAGLVTNLCEAATIHHQNLMDHADHLGMDVRLFFELGALFSAVDYLQAQQVRQQLKEDFNAALAKVDVLISPTLPVMPPDIGSDVAELNGRAVGVNDHFIRLTSPANLTGLPALSLPVGLDKGLPVGLQILGRALDEHTVLNVGKAIELGQPMANHTPPFI